MSGCSPNARIQDATPLFRLTDLFCHRTPDDLWKLASELNKRASAEHERGFSSCEKKYI